MGYVSIDHRHTVDPTGTKDGILEQFDTIACPHCQAVIRKIILGPCRTKPDSPGECDFCKKPICYACAERLKLDEHCPGEMREKIDRAWEEFNAKNALFFGMRR
jgi:hypothetical protein